MAIALEEPIDTSESSRDDEPAAIAPGRFRALLSATVASNLGDGVYQYGLPLLVVQVTTAPSAVALTTVMLTLGWPVFGLFAGSVVDGVDRRRLLIAVSLGRAVTLGVLLTAILLGSPPLILFYLAAFFLGLGETLVDTAMTAMVPAVVDRTRLEWANGRIMAAQTATNSFIGPPLTGFLVGIAGALVTLVGSVAFLITSVLTWRIPGTFRPAPDRRPAESTRLVDRLTEGFRFQWRNPVLRRLTLFTAAMNIWWSAWFPLFVVLAIAPAPVGLGLAEYQYGLIITAMAVGGVFGSLVADRLRQAIGLRLSLLIDFAGTALLVGVPGLTGNPFLLGASVFLAGLGSGVWVVLVSSLRQSLVPDRLLGRVYSASRLISWGVLPLGAGFGGLLAEAIGIRSVFLLGGAVSVGLFVAFALTMSAARLRSATEPPTATS